MNKARGVLVIVAAVAVGVLIGLGIVAASGKIADALGAPASCHTSHCWQQVHKRRAHRVCVRRHGRRACAWRIRYRALAPARRQYVAALMACEGGRFAPGVPDADGSGFVWRAEWSRTTWVAAGGDFAGAPSLWEEATRVSRWLDRVGFHVAAGWPRCPR